MDSNVSTSRYRLKSFPYWTYSAWVKPCKMVGTKWPLDGATVSSSQLYSLSQSLPDGEGNPEQHLGAFEENRVPDLEHRGRRQAGGEDGEEPLHGEHVGERRLVATWSETEASAHSRGPAEEAPMCSRALPPASLLADFWRRWRCWESLGSFRRSRSLNTAMSTDGRRGGGRS